MGVLFFFSAPYWKVRDQNQDWAIAALSINGFVFLYMMNLELCFCHPNIAMTNFSLFFGLNDAMKSLDHLGSSPEGVKIHVLALSCCLMDEVLEAGSRWMFLEWCLLQLPVEFEGL